MPDPQGRLIAIGDIHGCVRALDAILGAIAPTAADTVVILGDIVDRGPESKACVTRLIDLQRTCHVLAIMGNHEEMMLSWMIRQDPEELRYWIRYGGGPTIDSYGGPRALLGMDPDHLRFYERMLRSHETTGHIFVHANYDWHRPIAEADDETVRWLHLDPPNQKPHLSGRPVIVGHTSQRSFEPLNLGFLVCIDTGCHFGGWLTAYDPVQKVIWRADQSGFLISKEPEPLPQPIDPRDAAN
jgi:serine/threonine protein phosphatase 1